MPTSTRGGAAAPPQPTPQQVKPAGPLEPPHPILQAAGVNSGITAFNAKVAQIDAAHRVAYGVPPSPGLTLDVAKSDVQSQDYPKLFSVPRSPVVAQAQATLNKYVAANPDDVFHHRDGLQITRTPLTRRLHPQGPPTTAPDKLAASHPWVPRESGFLPIQHFGALAGALSRLDQQGVTTRNGQVVIGGQTVSQYEHQQTLGTAVNTGGTATIFPGAPKQLVLTEKAAAGLGANEARIGGVTRDITTVKQAQQELKTRFPAYFNQLPADGNFNQDWVSATARFQSSATYYRSSTLQLAADNHFQGRPGEFVKAWKAKQKAIQSDPTGRYFYSQIPLAFFGDGKSVVDFYTGDTHGWGFINLPTVALHAIAGVGRSTIDIASGLAGATKANLAGVTSYFQHVLPSYLGGKGEGDKEAMAASTKALEANPTWLRIVYPGLPAHPTGTLAAIDGASNLALDIILGNRLVVGGDAVKVGDYAGLRSSRYFKGATQLAYNSLRRRGIDGVGEASKLLQGGETLNVALADAAKSGELTLAQYRQHVADLYHHGQTSIGDAVLHAGDTPNSSVLTSLLEKNLPNPSLLHQRVKGALDQIDAGLHNSGLRGTDNTGNLFSAVRQLVARAAPRTEQRRIYDAKTPEDIYNWVVKNLKDRDLAYRARNQLVVARAKQDIPAIQELNRSLLERYAAEYPNVKGVRTPLEQSSGPQIEAESLSNFKFLSGREKDTQSALARLQRKANATNQKLLTLARFHRRVIISGAPIPGGESLFYKHAVADTLRRFVGHGKQFGFKLNAEQKAALADAQTFFKDNPAALRDYSANRAAAEIGEYAWLTRTRPESYTSFNTGDYLHDGKYLEGAGAYLRHLVTDDALNAYRQSSKTDRTALFRHVWHNSFYQNKIAASEDFQKDAAEIKRLVKDGEQQKKLLSDLKKSYAQDYADTLWNQYRAIDAAGAKAGLQNALEIAAQVAREHPGAKIDQALGGWIRDNQLAFDVREAPIKSSQFDGLMNYWVGKLLTFNKLNRRVFFDHVFADTYSELGKAGWDKADALAAATQLARTQTVYHMLDFSNMLQVEQNLRWLSYYATKHRLYWTWIARQFARKPLLAAAVTDIGNTLDSRGNLPVTLFGHRLVIPASRLVWANNTEYPETSPIIETGVRFGANIVKGENPSNAAADAFAAETATSGNVFTRQDQAIMLLAKSVGMLSGKEPATFGAAVHGMSPVQRAGFNKELHGVILAYRADHNGRYPSEADAVKAALLRSTGLETWRTNLFVPVLPDTSQPSEIQKLHKQFDQITNPAKRRDFLDKHPQLADSFGASQDQDLFLHEQPLWDQFNQINADRQQALERVRQQIDQHGYNKTAAAEIKAISVKYSADIQRLRRLDALTWKGSQTYPAGKIADNGEILTPGPWSRQLDGDPIAARAFLHEAFPDITKGQLDQHMIGQTVLDLQNEATRIRTLGWQKLGYPDAQHARDRLSQISQKLDVFRSFPKTATAKMVDDFYKVVDRYRAQRDAWTQRLANVSSSDKNVVFSEFRAWKEQYDHPITVTDPKTGQKVRFPSPVSWGLTELPPDQYQAALAQAVASRWQDISGYEKNLLGVKTPANVAQGWAAYEKAVAEYESGPSNPPLVEQQKRGVARQIDKAYPGFYKDFLFAEQPKIDRYERTTLYQQLPTDERATFDRYIGGPAKQVAQAIKANGHSTYYMRAWRTYVKTQLGPWLAGNKQMQAGLARYGPDFLNTLPSAG